MNTPDHLGKYAITEVLGQGAMGVVYKGFDPGIRRTVAIKTIRRELVEGERHAAAMLARFRNEAQAAGKLAHPGIVAVYDYGEDTAVAYIAMEYVEGNSLREYIGHGKRFAERDAVSVMSQLLEALGHAHDRRVWHRDIKPGNVIVMRNGKVKIADFGIARIEASELTQTGVMMGSPGYMAPEQYAAAQIDHRADLFAAGVVFYQLLTGAKPFVGTTEQVSYATCHTEPLRASRADPDKGWERYDPVLAKALAKKPEDRHQSAEAFRAAILAAHDAPAAAAVSEETIIVEVLRPAAAVELSGSPKPPPGRRPGPAPAAPARRWPWAVGALVVAALAAGAAAWRFIPAGAPKPDVEAQLSKARADAEEAMRQAQTAAAAAEKARRELEIERAAEAKARTEAKPARPRPAAEPPRRAAEPAPVVARAEPEPAPVAARAEPAPAPAPSSGSSSFIPSNLWGSASSRSAPAKPAASAPVYDGAWAATRTCDAYEELPSQSASWSLNVKDGEFVVAVGTPGQPGYSQARGRPNDDGVLTLKGEGIAVAKRFQGMAHPVFFRGRAEGNRIVLKGSLGDRNCTLVLARR
jgi:eukaryotic-like serine/threonine-protein kinase